MSIPSASVVYGEVGAMADKLVVRTGDLRDALGFIANMVYAREFASFTRAPVTLRADGNKLAMYLSSLSVSALVTIDSEGSCRVRVPHDALYAVLSDDDDDETELHVSSTLRVNSGRTKASLKILEPLEIPEDDNSYKATIELDSQSFTSALQAVSYAVDRKDSILSGINMDIYDNKLIITATDRFALARTSLDIQNNGLAINITIPASIVPRLKYIDRNELELKVAPSILRISGDSRTVWITAISGTYPSIPDLLSKVKHSYTLPRIDILRIAERFMGFGSRGNRMNIRIKDGVLTGSVESPAMGSVMTELECDKDDAEIDVDISAKYIIGALGSMNSDSVVWGWPEKNNDGKYVFTLITAGNQSHLIASMV